MAVQPRREFLRQSGIAAGALLAQQALSASAADAPVGASETKEASAEPVELAVMGVNGRGLGLAQGFIGLKNCRISYVCDVDRRARDRAVETIAKVQGAPPKPIVDFRQALDDKKLHGLVVAAPDHWHAPAAILGCQAGKHVYVEKPCCHNPQEGEWLLAAAEKHQRFVMMGAQRRSWPHVQEAIQKLAGGAIGRVILSRGWYNNRRDAIGRGKPAAVPEHLDWKLWQGPAPERPFQDNVVHYNWHWFWHWGTGELGNNGVHGLDLCRWGLGVDFPIRVTSAGGKYRHEDDQETPDTHIVTYEFAGRRTITWEGLSWCPHGFEGTAFGVSFHGDEGSLILLDNKYLIYDDHEKLVEEKKATSTSDAVHLARFLGGVRENSTNRDLITQAYRSTLLCHLGNIAHRVGAALTIDPKSGHILGHAAAEKLWGREYQKEFAPKV